MQSFLDRRAVLNLKKRQTVVSSAAAGGKSVTTPNSPRALAVKQIKRSDKSNGSYGGAEIDEIKVGDVNLALLTDKLGAFQQQ